MQDECIILEHLDLQLCKLWPANNRAGSWPVGQDLGQWAKWLILMDLWVDYNSVGQDVGHLPKCERS